MNHGIRKLLRIERNTADLDRAIAFYRDALGFHAGTVTTQPPAWTGLPATGSAPSHCVRLSLGDQHIALTEFPDAPTYPADSTCCDAHFQHCAIVVNDMATAHARVMQHGATPITRDGPQTLPPATGSVTAFKFRDPDGHPLELIAFPDGVGDPIWQSGQANEPTLGIDHSAIGVVAVARNIEFFELLGLRVASRGLNHGVEQQRLDDFAAVEVDVIALQPAHARTPHLELLGYRRPPACATQRLPLNAIAADRLVWQVDGLDVLLDAIFDADCPDTLITTGRVAGTDLALLYAPDGHISLLIQGET